METFSLQQDHRSLQTGNYSAEHQQAYCVYKNYQHEERVKEGMRNRGRE